MRRLLVKASSAPLYTSALCFRPRRRTSVKVFAHVDVFKCHENIQTAGEAQYRWDHATNLKQRNQRRHLPRITQTDLRNPGLRVRQASRCNGLGKFLLQEHTGFALLSGWTLQTIAASPLDALACTLLRRSVYPSRSAKRRRCTICILYHIPAKPDFACGRG